MQLLDIGARTDVLVTPSGSIYDPLVASVLKNTSDASNGNLTIFLYPRMKRTDPGLFGLTEGQHYQFVDEWRERGVYDWLKGLSPSIQNNGWFYHSTGHFAVNLAVFACAKVSVVGFGLGRLTLFHHGFVLEAALLELYDQAGIIKLEMPEAVRYRLRAYIHNLHKSGVLKRV